MADDRKERYINPYTDFGFKKLFGTEMNKDLLISFLNALFNDSEQEIEDVQYLNSENLGDGYGDRRSVFDVYCMAKDGSRFIVEMQKAEQAYFKDRSQYEASQKEYWDYTSTMDTAYMKGEKKGIEIGLEKGRAEGEAKGIEIGLEKGRAEGEAKGIEKGRAEGRAEGIIETARKMKADGLPCEVIAKYTGLTTDEISKL